MAIDSFFSQVYSVVRTIPSGRVATYGQIAKLLGTRDSRRVGHALHANPDQGTPCHRVVFANGALAPGFAFGGPNEQKRLLQLEGVTFASNNCVKLGSHLWKP